LIEAPDANRDRGVHALVTFEHVAKVYFRDDVGVHDQNGIGDAELIAGKADGPGGAEARFFARVVDVDTKARAVLKKGFDKLGAVPHGEVDVRDAVHDQVLDQDFENRFFAHGDKGLGDGEGEWAQARAEAAGEDNGFH